ncbi:hypothetical protein TcCL_NonESM07539 [Trypanosoma cruzi]|nr:hypothetical protein TcCL_NonESM07539 [Trypanosoma cruzi]
MSIVSHLWTRRVYMPLPRRIQKNLLEAPTAIKKRRRSCPPPMNADDGSPIHSATPHQSAQTSRRTADAPSGNSNSPTQSSGRAMEPVRQRRSNVVRRITGSSALGQPPEEREQGGSRDVGAVNVGAWNVSRGAIQDFLPHARTHDGRGELRGLSDGDSRRGAIDPTAVRQDAVVNAANESNPAGNDDSGVTKNCGANGDEAGAPLNKGRDGRIYPPPDRLEATCFFDLRG